MSRALHLAAFVLAAPSVAFGQGGPWAVWANSDNSGAQVGGLLLNDLDMSATGRQVAFVTTASMVPLDVNGSYSAYVRDLDAQTTRLVGEVGGTAPGGDTQWVALSGAGRFAAFSTSASNLGVPDANFAHDVYVHDLVGGSIVRASFSAGGGDPDNLCGWPDVSDDGRRVVYRSGATNIDAAASAGFDQIYLRDLPSGVTTLVSKSPAGAAANWFCTGNPRVSADGRFVVFESGANNLLASDLNPGYDVFRYEVATGVLLLASSNASGASVANFNFQSADVSANGRYVSFSTIAPLAANDTNGGEDVYVKDLLTGALTLISTGPSGVAEGGSLPRISADGKHVSFMSGALALDPAKTTGQLELFIRDIPTATTQRISTSPVGADANSICLNSAISGNGRRAAFVTAATNIVLPDLYSNFYDVVARDRGAPAVPTVYCVPKVNSLGCTPTLTYTGTPSVSLAGGFLLSVNQLLNNKSGTLFYSLGGPSNLPFSGGFLCVQAPLRRTPVSLTGGSAGGNDCTGQMTRDFNAWIAGGVDPQLVAGQEVWAQFYSRDPGFAPPNNVNLTEAIDFLIQP
jgi:Tol biopolymer transport system component